MNPAALMRNPANVLLVGSGGRIWHFFDAYSAQEDGMISGSTICSRRRWQKPAAKTAATGTFYRSGRPVAG
jgi:hypothetical protein